MTIYLVQAESGEYSDYRCWPVTYSKTREGAEKAIAIINDKRESLTKRIVATREEHDLQYKKAKEIVSVEITEKHGPCPEYIQDEYAWRKLDLNRRAYYNWHGLVNQHALVLDTYKTGKTAIEELEKLYNKLLNFNSGDYVYLQSVDTLSVVEVQEG